MIFYIYAYKRETASHKSKHVERLSANGQNEMGGETMNVTQHLVD